LSLLFFYVPARCLALRKLAVLRHRSLRAISTARERLSVKREERRTPLAAYVSAANARLHAVGSAVATAGNVTKCMLCASTLDHLAKDASTEAEERAREYFGALKSGRLLTIRVMMSSSRHSRCYWRG
jgi:hypothetical protein